MRRKRLTLLAVVALVLALWMLLGRPGLNRSASGDHGSRDDGAPGVLQLASSDGAGGGAVPTVASGQSIDAPAEPQLRVLADRWSGHVFRLRASIVAGRLGAACAEWDAIERLPWPSPGSTPRDDVGHELTVAMNDAGPRLREAIRVGRILEAHERIVDARAQPHARVEAMLRALALDFDLQAFPDALSSPPITGVEAMPAVPEGRLVRVRFRDHWQSGRIVGVSRASFTVKVETVDGVYFPVKACAEIEPVDPSLDEAMQQVALAAAAGDRLGAVLWLCHLHQRSDKDGAAVRAWRERLL